MNFNDLVVNSDEKLYYLRNNPLNLTKSEYNLLTFLLENQNKIFSREDLIKEAWIEPVSTRAVDTAVSRLRKKLEDYNKHLITRLGFGYGWFKD